MTKRQLEKDAEKEFIKQLNKTINLAYQAGIENRGDVLTLPIKELYSDLIKRNKKAWQTNRKILLSFYERTKRKSSGIRSNH